MPHTPEIAVPIGRFSELAQWRSVYEWDLELVRGDTLEIIFRVFREVDCEGHGSRPQVLTGMSARARVRSAVDYPIYTDLTCSVDAPTGRITVTATSEQTSLMKEYGIFELQVYETSGTMQKVIVQGQLKMTRDIIQ